MSINDSSIFTYIYDSEFTQEELEDLFEGVQLAKEFVEKSSNRYILSRERGTILERYNPIDKE